MKTTARVLILFCLLLGYLLYTKNIYAHPGNTASDDCHYCRTNCDSWGELWDERHCHNGGSVPAPNPPTQYIVPLTTTMPTKVPTPLPTKIPTPSPTSTVLAKTAPPQTPTPVPSVLPTLTPTVVPSTPETNIETPKPKLPPTVDTSQDVVNAAIAGFGTSGVVGFGLYKYVKRSGKTES